MKSDLDSNALDVAKKLWALLPGPERTAIRLTKLFSELKKLASIAYDHGATDALQNWQL